MAELDIDDFAQLPDDPVLAFALLEQSMYSKVDRNRDKDGDPTLDVMKDYIDTMTTFNEEHDLMLIGEYQYENNYQDINDKYNQLRDECRKLSLKIRIGVAKSQKKGIIPIIILDPNQRQTIHHLIEAIREKLDQLSLSEKKRESLFDKLNAFAAEVDRNRTRTEAIFAFGVEASRAAKEIGENISPIEQTLDRIFDLVEKAKKLASDSFPAWTARKQIEPPKSE